MVQNHGANIYHPDGSKAGLLDFSNSVVEVPPPAGWDKRLARQLGELRHYPQPYATGLATKIESRLRLKAGSVLVGNGSSECLSWIAQSLAGKHVLVESPCFGEYAIWLSRYHTEYKELGADEPYAPDWDRVKQELWDSDAIWIANPTNPAGLEFTAKEFQQQLAYCRSMGILFVLDEALHAQSLKSKGDRFLKACVSEPGALVVRSLSKGLGLPGLRLGYVAGHPVEIAKLGQFVDPWNVSSLAQSAGAWIFDEERRTEAARRKILASWKTDLLKRLGSLGPHRLMPKESDSGFFLCRLLGRWDDSRRLAAALKRQGVLVRSCSSYGGWGTGYIRLNPRQPKDNASLIRALKVVYGQA